MRCGPPRSRRRCACRRRRTARTAPPARVARGLHPPQVRAAEFLPPAESLLHARGAAADGTAAAPAAPSAAVEAGEVAGDDAQSPPPKKARGLPPAVRTALERELRAACKADEPLRALQLLLGGAYAEDGLEGDERKAMAAMRAGLVEECKTDGAPLCAQLILMHNAPPELPKPSGDAPPPAVALEGHAHSPDSPSQLTDNLAAAAASVEAAAATVEAAARETAANVEARAAELSAGAAELTAGLAAKLSAAAKAVVDHIEGDPPEGGALASATPAQAAAAEEGGALAADPRTAPPVASTPAPTPAAAPAAAMADEAAPATAMADEAAPAAAMADEAAEVMVAQPQAAGTAEESAGAVVAVAAIATAPAAAPATADDDIL